MYTSWLHVNHEETQLIFSYEDSWVFQKDEAFGRLEAGELTAIKTPQMRIR